MAEEPDAPRRHFILDGVTETEPYRYPGSGGDGPSRPPARDRAQHGAALQHQIDELRGVAASTRQAQQAAGMEDGLGLQVEFESFPDIELAFESLARDEGEGTRRGSGSDPAWLIGTRARHRGSLHCDIWRGTAADLASRGVIAVYQTSGWWKSRPALERYDKSARYTLIVSIKAPEVDVDLYTEVENRIAVRIDTEL